MQVEGEVRAQQDHDGTGRQARGDGRRVQDLPRHGVLAERLSKLPFRVFQHGKPAAQGGAVAGRLDVAREGTGQGVALSSRDRAICAAVGPRLRELGLWFVGLDVIGDYLTEINVTSPTCIRELDSLYDLDIGGRLLDALERHRQVGAGG